jgi:hypothetical protein
MEYSEQTILLQILPSLYGSTGSRLGTLSHELVEKKSLPVRDDGVVCLRRICLGRMLNFHLVILWKGCGTRRRGPLMPG